MARRLAGVRRRRKGTVRPIRFLGDPVLRTPTDPVTVFDRELERLVEDMFASMYEAEGVGLAANQIGVGLSVFVYDCHDDDDNWFVGHIINPVLVESDGEPTTDSEGCLSLPGLRYETIRGWHAAVEGVDMHGEPVRAEGTGNFARCLQHETDHLIGKVYVDRLESEARRVAMRDVRAAEWSA
ncbi:MAG TPA: peptide deformylase [Mycobacteriales bacterium]|jgi:peptide deformylase|nr:peptide deformylase [Mycobacteriales bacterium]